MPPYKAKKPRQFKTPLRFFNQKRWCLIDIFGECAITGKDGKTLLFSSEQVAEEMAPFFFDNRQECLIVELKY